MFEIPIAIKQVLELTPKESHPMDVLKTTCSVLGTLYPEKDINDRSETLNIADRLIAVFPSAMCYHYNYHFNGTRIDTKSVEFAINFENLSIL